MSRNAICTIVAKNYLAFARSLAESFRAHHPDDDIFVLLIDDVEGKFDPATENFTTLQLDDLGMDAETLTGMIWRYSILEFSTAVKPFLLAHLFDDRGYDKVCYFDPDIYFFAPIDPIWQALESHSMVLTPHLLGFLADDHHPSELSILQSGTYNLGFVGLTQGPELSRFLGWWQQKLIRHCVVAIEKGLFVDQKWMDMAPGFFDGVYIHRDPACNVAYWNLNHRLVEGTRQTGYTVNGNPLIFFHFSGFAPDAIETVSKHQDRFRLNDLPPAVRELYEGYRERILAHDHQAAKKWAYTHNVDKASGIQIPDIARRFWREWELDHPNQDLFEGSGSDVGFVPRLLAWLNEPSDTLPAGDPMITRMALALYQQRVDLRLAFPDIAGTNRWDYANWFVSRAKAEQKLDDRFIDPMRRSLRQSRQPLLGGNSGLPWRERLYWGIVNWIFRMGIGQWMEKQLGNGGIRSLRRIFLRETSTAPAGRGPGIAQADAPVPELDGQATDEALGINVVGYLRDETGVGEVARAAIKALHSQRFPVAITPVSGEISRKNDRSVLDLGLPEGNPYGVNWLHVNADQVPNVATQLGKEFFAGKYTVGYWAWELDEFPDNWLDRFYYFDEIWVGSAFVQNTLAHVASIPILKIGAPVAYRPDPGISRRQLGLDEEKFTYLFAFDMLSFIQRKNPLAAIDAFRKAFGGPSAHAQLVVKVTNLDHFPEHRRTLTQALNSIDGVLIDRYMDRDQLDGLFHRADAYLSLHRSEGFGMTMAEAMALGKPTIATAYSGNTDFMNVANSYPVAYNLIEIDQDYGPYRQGQHWADPEIDHAAAQMVHVFENRDEAARRGQRGAADIQALYGPTVMAERIVARLRHLAQGI